MPIVDVARGCALVAMFVYHFAWDLSFYGFIETNVVTHSWWSAFAHGIAGSFLALVGVSLVLAHRTGLRTGAFLRRLAVVAAAAAAITLGTWIALPEGFIFFGVLHCIAVASVLALPFLRLPVIAALVAAAFCFAAPSLLSMPLFDAPWLRWLGLMTYPPRTNDYVPIFPWFGMVLLGVAAARIVLAGWPEAPFLRRPRTGVAARLLIWGGRHSLPLYLVHQPLFFGALYLASLAFTPGIEAQTASFMNNCTTSCVEPGRTAEVCEHACDCVAGGLKANGLWEQTRRGRLSEAESQRVAALARSCAMMPGEAPRP